MYVSEIRDLLDSLLFRIHALRQARDAWLSHDRAASAHAVAGPDDFDQQQFSSALGAAMQQQTTIFDAFEALLAAWARLSLLLHPIPGRDALASWRLERGEKLRAVLNLANNTLLSSRTFRDSWMHFDERLDASVVEGWLGNRQQFVKSAGVVNATQHSVRVIDIETLAFHYRTRDGMLERVTIDEMETCLDLVQSGLQGAGPRIVNLLPSA
jgi:hypothetical protein